MPHIHVTCAIIERNGHVLATQRSSSMKLPLKWEFPGGKIESDDGVSKNCRFEKFLFSRKMALTRQRQILPHEPSPSRSARHLLGHIKERIIIHPLYIALQRQIVIPKLCSPDRQVPPWPFWDRQVPPWLFRDRQAPAWLFQGLFLPGLSL